MTDQSWTPPWRQAVPAPRPDLALLALPGVDQLRTWVQQHPKPPLARLAGMDFTDVQEDHVVLDLQLSGWLAGPKGAVHPGFLGWLADSALACAVQVALPPAVLYTTAELSLTFLGKVHVPAGPLTARGWHVGQYDDDHMSAVSITDRSGRVVAYGTSRCASFPIDLPNPLPPPVVQPSYAGVEPWQQPVVGDLLSAEVLSGRTGLDALRGQVTGALPLPPIHHLTGITPVAADEGTVTFSLPTGPWLQTITGTVYGGALTFLASSAVSGSAQTVAKSASSCDTLDIKVNFLRPAAPDGRDLLATGEVVHGGRTIVVSRGEIVDADGRLIALATGSTRLRNS